MRNLVKIDNKLFEASSRYHVDKVIKVSTGHQSSFVGSVWIKTDLSEGAMCQLISDGQIETRDRVAKVLAQGCVKVEFHWQASLYVEGQTKYEAVLCIVPVQTLSVENCCTVLF
jgi:hypothetical protein